MGDLKQLIGWRMALQKSMEQNLYSDNPDMLEYCKAEFKKVNEQIAALAGTDASKPPEMIPDDPLMQFHLTDAKGNPTGVFDEAIFKHIKNEYSLFVCGGVIYLYEGGVYLADSTGARIKTIISSLIYERFVKSPTLKRVYDRFLCDAELIKDFEDLNKYPSWWICFQNGMYDCKTGELLEHSPKYLCLNQIPHIYEPGKECEGAHIEKFLHFAIPDEADREMLLQFAGYCLTKDTAQQKFLIFNGLGGSGKSTLIRLIEAAVGGHNTASVSLQDLEQRFASYGLLGKLLNSCADLEATCMENVSTVKKLLGEDSIRGEAKGKDAISFRNYAKLLFSANELPTVKSEKTNGFFRRVMVLGMNNKPEQKDTGLFIQLMEELPYFINLIVAAVERMYKSGILAESENSKIAVEQLRKDSDTVQAFLLDKTVKDSNGRIERTDLFGQYEAYCEEVERQSVTRNNFYKSLRYKGYSESGENGRRYFRGISYKDGGFMQISEDLQHELPFY